VNDQIFRENLIDQQQAADAPFALFLGTVRPLINDHIMSILNQSTFKSWTSSNLRNYLSHGKRTRAGLALLVFSTFSDEPEWNTKILDLSASLEIAHSASLILDDMIDGDELRRGREALHIKEGSQKALLEMVGILSIPYSITSRYRGDCVELMAKTHQSMVQAELAEFDTSFDQPSKTYDHLIAQKTGKLFSLSAQFGGMAAGCTSRQIDQLAKFGLFTGMAVQHADDICDHAVDSKNGTIRRSVAQIARSVDDQSRNDWSTENKDKEMEILKGRLKKADEALSSALAETSDFMGHNASMASCLRHAPSEMVNMMLQEDGCRTLTIPSDDP
jgi:geranylgeranyl pyrophosphate synthase